jgi:hypothetical protein
MRVIELEALDGSKWYIPAAIVQASWAAHYGETFAENEELDEDELLDWAKGDMNWSDVREHARQVKEADPCDMQESWTEGDMAVIDVDMPPSCDPVGAPATTPLGEDGPLLAVPVDMAEAERLVGVTRQAIENAAIGRYWPQACVAMRDHVHQGRVTAEETVMADGATVSLALTGSNVGVTAAPTLTGYVCFGGVTVRPDGTVQIAPGADLDEATRAFWAGVEKMGFKRDAERTAVEVKTVRPEDTAIVIASRYASYQQIDQLRGVLRAEVDKAREEGNRRFRCVVMVGHNVETAKEAAALLTRAEMLDLYNGMKDDAPTILANVEPGDHGDAILEAFGRRAVEATLQRMGGE